MDDIKSFTDGLVNEYGIETLINCSLYQVLIFSTLKSNVDRLDLEPEEGLDIGPIEYFIRHTLPNRKD
jgi:hypothetical protein